MRTGFKTIRAAFSLLSLMVLLTGCQGVGSRSSVAVNTENTATAEAVAASSANSVGEQLQTIVPLPSVEGGAEVNAVSFVVGEMEEIPAPDTLGEDLEHPTLDVEYVVAQVLAVNPDIRSASAAWRAAARRYPQEVALDDPMFGYLLGPGSWGSNDVDDAYMVEISQRIPWHGKRQLRGNKARAEANAAFHDVAEERLRVAEVARLAYYEYYLAHRQIEVLNESTQLLTDFREIAVSKYESSSVEQQDVLLVDVELGEQQRQLLELTRQEQVARARINTLLLTAPNATLPPPPVELPTDAALIPAEDLRGIAIAQRPELAAQAARIRAERYELSLACKEFYPDLEFVGRYDAFWQVPEDDLRPMVGMNLNLPIYKDKRYAAVAEAHARIAKEQAEYDAKTVEIAYEVEQTFRRVEESQQTITLYEDKIIPTARHSIDAARASYLAGKLDLLRLIESQRQLLNLRDEYYSAIAEYYGRLTELERLVGVSPLALFSE
jgi:cobalt-zinc-cadmium efflux system outer membrane protein